MKNKSGRLIYHEEYVHINGIDQYLFHSGMKYDNSVMLFLHENILRRLLRHTKNYI